MPESMPQKEITFLIDSNLDNVSLAGVAVRGICSYLSLTEADAYYLELCVVEAVNNAIKHAYGSEAGHTVEINIIYSKDGITFEISDWGEKMLSQGLPRLNFDAGNPVTIPERGMGLFIIDSVMDKVIYSSEGAKNTLTMCKYFHYKK